MNKMPLFIISDYFILIWRNAGDLNGQNSSIYSLKKKKKQNQTTASRVHILGIFFRLYFCHL